MALDSMEAFVALLTGDFHESSWTDQEVGFALARAVPILAIRMGRDPYGFLGKFQGLTCKWETTPKETARLLIKQPRMLDSYIDAVVSCGDWNGSNTLAALLPEIDHLRDNQIDRLIRAYRENREVNGSFGFNGTNPGSYGPGLRGT